MLRRGVGADRSFQSIGKENDQRSDAVRCYHSFRSCGTALEFCRITHGFLGAGRRDCGGRCIGVWATHAGLAAKPRHSTAKLIPAFPRMSESDPLLRSLCSHSVCGTELVMARQGSTYGGLIAQCPM